MDYTSYMKNELQDIIFVEIAKDINLNEKIRLNKGEYPLHSSDFTDITKKGTGNIPINAIINGILYIIACDKDFKYNQYYIDTLKSINGIESYIIKEVEANKDKNIKKSLVYLTALCSFKQEKIYLYNRAIILMNLYEKDNMFFLENEIIHSLKEITELYPDFIMPNYHLGRYYLKKDKDISKFYLTKCLESTDVSQEAQELILKIQSVELYDEAIDMVKKGEGTEALGILMRYIEDDADNPNAKFYLAMALRQSGYYEKALNYIKEVLEYGPSVDVFCEMGIIYASLKDFSCALESFQKAFEIKRNDADILCNIGVCYLNMGDIRNALKTFSSVLKINPKDSVAKEWINKINV